MIKKKRELEIFSLPKMAKAFFFLAVFLGITAGLVLASGQASGVPAPPGLAYKAPGLHLASWPFPTSTPTPPPPPPPSPTPYCECLIYPGGWECITCCY